MIESMTLWPSAIPRPVEVVVRDDLAGTTGTSILPLYKQGQRSMYGDTLPEGLRDNQRPPRPIITPSSKAFDAGHDEPLTPDEILTQGLLTASSGRRCQPTRWRFSTAASASPPSEA